MICRRCIHDLQGCVTPEGKLIPTVISELVSTNIAVLVSTLEFERQAMAAKKKERRAKVKGKAKVVGPLKAVIHKSSLFSTDVFFG
jgi:hypothetical protein